MAGLTAGSSWTLSTTSESNESPTPVAADAKPISVPIAVSVAAPGSITPTAVLAAPAEDESKSEGKHHSYGPSKGRLSGRVRRVY